MQGNAYSFDNIKRWTKKVCQSCVVLTRADHRFAVWKIDVFGSDMVVIPMHVSGNHWCLAVVNLRAKRFEYYDSLGGRPDCLKVRPACQSIVSLILAHSQNFRLWLQDEHKERQLQTPLDLSQCATRVG
jgi:Ulp1 family protease